MARDATSNTTTGCSKSTYRFHDTLDKIEKAYIPGAIAFFGKFDPDPWQLANDELERALKTKDDDEIRNASINYESTCLSLLEKYKKHLEMFHQKPEWSSDAEEGFYSRATYLVNE